MRGSLLLLACLCLSYTTIFGQDQLINFLSRYSTGIFDEGAAEIAAYDPGTQRLFFTNGEEDRIEVLDLSNPANPVQLTPIDISSFGDGINSVDVANSVVAAAIEGDDFNQPGKVVFFDATDGSFLSEVPAGVLPDMLTFTADGTKLLVANEGEPNDSATVDPEGSITIVDLAGGAGSATATQINLQDWNDKKQTLRNRGVRLFFQLQPNGDESSVAQDLEPEYITVLPGDSVAYAICQENNALLIININQGTIEDIVALGDKDYNTGTPELEEFLLNEIPDWPALGKPLTQMDTVFLGGFSGLYYDGTQSTEDNWVFYAVPDRGPNDGAVNRNSAFSVVDSSNATTNLRPFKLPNYQGRMVKFSLNPTTGDVALDEQVFLSRPGPNGLTPITGFGNAATIDETPVTRVDTAVYTDTAWVATIGDEDVYFAQLDFDPFGGDFEGILRDNDGNFWMCDEYRPAIYKFDTAGVLLERFIPKGTKTNVVTNGLFFSEYGESGSTKYLEIYNGTGDTVNLEDYILAFCTNGCDATDELDEYQTGVFEGRSIPNGGTFVMANSGADSLVAARADTTLGIIDFNGNDYVALLLAADSALVDQIGDTSAVGGPWAVAGIEDATEDVTLIRKQSVLSGNLDWAGSAGTDSLNSEWIVGPIPVNEYTPISLGTHMDFGSMTLPFEYNNRRANRGFEALAYDSTNNIVYAFIQSPLDNPSSDIRHSDVIRILGIDPTDGTPVSEYLYLLEKNQLGVNGRSRVDKMGDAVFVGNNRFLVLERDSGTPLDENPSTFKKFVYEINLTGATNILDSAIARQDTGVTLESLTADVLVDSFGIQPVFKIKILNLPSIGYIPSDKPEGIAALPGGQIAVLNDNDFGIAGAGVSDNSSLGIISFGTDNGIDPTNEDGVASIRNVPIRSFYQPDAITSLGQNGINYILTANEGDAREYIAEDDEGNEFEGFVEEARGDDLLLNPDYFDMAVVDSFQNDAAYGRIVITLADGDLDDDGLYEVVYGFGARSFSIWDELGNLVWDSGNDFETITAAQLPNHFNSTNDDNDSFDNRSDDKGPEPEAITTGVVGDSLYAFIGLERIGGIMAYNITDINAPRFVEYVNTRNFEVAADSSEAGELGPEDLVYVAAEDSPINIPMLISANEVSGTVAIFTLGDIFTSIEEPSVDAISLKVFPNPASELLNVNRVSDYVIYNTVGKLMARYGNTQVLNVSQFPAGTYVITDLKENTSILFAKH